ncbi:unnamed protein product [Allacma fusca]|uniref:Arrestin C-terminal-like domain-containing protein n=1 Tax=Allacma fusca TaxID=39272 RepID=A0A8J2LIL8_9HEXA|nr:unnamed protein product [Allacma fusca]
MVRRERIVWCCGASGWTRVIAWLQMLTCVTGTLTAFICIVGILRGDEISRSGWGIVGELITIITHAAGAMMGYILLKGSQMANVEHLNMWIGYTVIAGIVYIVTFLGAGIISGGFFIFGMASLAFSGNMATAIVVNGFGLTVQLDTEFNIYVDEDPTLGSDLSGRVELNVLKPIDIYGLGVFLGLTNIGRILKTETGEGSKKGKKPEPKYWTVNTSCQYLPWADNFTVLLGKKTPDLQAWLDESLKPTTYTSGTHSFPFQFDLKAMETLNNFEYDAPRGQVSVQNKLMLFVATNSMSLGRTVVYPPGRTVTLPYFANMERSLKKPGSSSCCLKSGPKEIAKFTLKLNQQGYLFGDTIEFKLERSQQANVRVRDFVVELVRKISVTTPQREVRPVFWRLHECKYPKKFTLERKVLGTCSTRTNESTWSGTFVLPEGPPDTSGLTIEFNYLVELTVNIFGVIQPLKAFVPFKTGAFWEGGDGLPKRRHSRLGMFPLGSIASFACFEAESDLDNISMASLPPEYSLLSSRAGSFDTLPPPYPDESAETAEQLADLGLGTSK